MSRASTFVHSLDTPLTSGLRFLAEVIAWVAGPWAAAEQSIWLVVPTVVLLVGLPAIFSTPGDKRQIVVATPGPLRVARPPRGGDCRVLASLARLAGRRRYRCRRCGGGDRYPTDAVAAPWSAGAKVEADLLGGLYLRCARDVDAGEVWRTDVEETRRAARVDGTQLIAYVDSAVAGAAQRDVGGLQ